MFNRISSITLAILLFAVLISSSKGHITVFVASLIILMIVTFIINVKRIGLSWPHLLLPMLYLLGLGCVFMVITSPSLRLLFLLAASIAFYLVEINLGRESHFLQDIYLFSVFALYMGVFALHFYLHLGTLTVVTLMFALTFIFSIQGFAGFSLPAKKYFYLMTALTIAEISWGLTLWPTHYIVNTVLAFCVYYLLWIFSFAAFFGKLTLKKIYLQMALVIFVLAVTFFSASWMPLVS